MQITLVIVALCVAILFMAKKIYNTLRHRTCESCSRCSTSACRTCEEKRLEELKPR